jgi:SPP1 family predicted phage head-tail adaptor
MKSGPLRDRITVQVQSSVQDEAGQQLTTWTDVAKLWANVEYTSGLSAIRSGMDTSNVKASIRIRYREGINAGMRVIFGATDFDIEGVLPHKSAGMIDLVCQTKNAQS